MINIYKLFHKEDETLSYVGRTEYPIEVRKYQHWMDRNKFSSGKASTAVAALMLSEPYESFQITLLESCDSSIAREREQHWISLYGTLNMRNEIKNPESEKVWRKLNKPWIKRDKSLHNQQERERYQQNKSVILVRLSSNRILCECGMEIRKQHHKRHLSGSYHSYLLSERGKSS